MLFPPPPISGRLPMYIPKNLFISFFSTATDMASSWCNFLQRLSWFPSLPFRMLSWGHSCTGHVAQYSVVCCTWVQSFGRQSNGGASRYSCLCHTCILPLRFHSCYGVISLVSACNSQTVTRELHDQMRTRLTSLGFCWRGCCWACGSIGLFYVHLQSQGRKTSSLQGGCRNLCGCAWCLRSFARASLWFGNSQIQDLACQGI